jgi:hypothetical protein
VLSIPVNPADKGVVLRGCGEGADCQTDCAAEKSVENALSRALVEGNLLRNRRDILLSNIQ